MDWIGKKVTGTRWDIHGGRTNLKEYRYGYRTRGIIIRYRERKYEIEGIQYIVTPGGVQDREGKDCFYDSQIEVEAEREKSELCLTK